MTTRKEYEDAARKLVSLAAGVQESLCGTCTRCQFIKEAYLFLMNLVQFLERPESPDQKYCNSCCSYYGGVHLCVGSRVAQNME